MTRRLAPHPADRKTAINGGRILIVGAVTILAAAALWTAVWFYMASRLEAQTRGIIADLDEQGAAVSCTALGAHGYPFRLGLSCEQLDFATRDGRYAARAPGFRSTAPLYDPGQLAGRAEGPASLLWPGLPPLRLQWDELRFSTSLAEPLPDEVTARCRSRDCGVCRWRSARLADFPGGRTRPRQGRRP